MHDVKQGAGTLVCHQLVDRDGKIQKFASQVTKEHRQNDDLDRKNQKSVSKETQVHCQPYERDGYILK